MAQADFTTQLKELGFTVEDLGGGRVCVPFTVPTGKFSGTAIRLGFQVPEDFEITPPSGPHISPRLLPNQSGGEHPNGGVHDSPFGPDWHYWSRPLSHWKDSTKKVKDVLAHVRHLFDTQ